jgi:hypothetical protein
MKTILLRNWNLVRAFRLAIGVWAIVSAWQTREALVGLMDGVLVAMAFMNVDCCRTSGCNTYPTKKESTRIPEKVNYEEIS